MQTVEELLATHGQEIVQPQQVQHYGVRGMKWGVRKRRDSGGSSSPEDVKIETRPGKGIKTSGGRNQPASDDAKKAAAYRQKAKSSTVHALSNQELQALITRMNLEANYAKVMAANAPQKSAGRKFIENFLKSELEGQFKGTDGPGVKIAKTATAFAKGRRSRRATARAAAATGKVLSGVVVKT